MLPCGGMPFATPENHVHFPRRSSPTLSLLAMPGRLGLVVIAELTAAALGTGCAARSPTRTNSDLVASGLPTAAGRNDVLNAAEIARAIGITSAADAIGRLRPQYLRRNGRVGPTSSVQPAVYLNLQHAGGLEALERIRAADIREIRYVPPSDARQRFGPSVNGAVILVLTW